MIVRLLSKTLQPVMKRKKIILVLGARQVGKTTLLDGLIENCHNPLRLNCDEMDDRNLLTDRSSTELKSLIGSHDAVLIDEAQKVHGIGLTLKKIGDMKLSVPVFVTGSSSLELADDINESAAGRILDYNLYPISIAELVEDTSEREERRMLENRLIYGTYPEVVNDLSFAKKTLSVLLNSYLYKDILAYKGLKKPEVLEKLVRALAFQIGSEVNYNELSKTVGADKETVESYINLLEKCFVVFRLGSYSRNLRNEIVKGKKIYFYDNGIRNAIINNFAPLDLRNDGGALWENFMVSERLKANSYAQNFTKMFFWRTHAQQEIDLIEETDGKLQAFEFKLRENASAKCPKSFATAYPGSTFSVVHPGNYMGFVVNPVGF